MTTTAVFANTGLNGPRAMAFDNSGILHCANYNANTISQISQGGSVSFFVNTGGGPAGLAFDSSGNLYCSNYLNSSISKITPEGTVSVFVSSINGPSSLAFDGSGNLYCANYLNNSISKITPEGTVSSFVNTGNGPIGLAFDISGNLYCANYLDNSVSKITSGGTVSVFVSSINSPSSLAFDSSGNLYCASYSTGAISEIAPDGTVNPVPVVNGLSGPFDIDLDSSGNLYCANFSNNTITKTTFSNLPSPSLGTLDTQSPKTYGNIPYVLTDPTSISDGEFSYTSSNESVAIVSNQTKTVTIIAPGSTLITATQEATSSYSSASTASLLQVNQSTPINPTILQTGYELLYFMNTTSKYGNITNDITITDNLFATTSKIICTNSNTKITFITPS